MKARLTVLLLAGLAGPAMGQPRPSPRPPSNKKPAAQSVDSSPTYPCKRPAATTRFKVSMKPDTEVADLIAWYSALSCTATLTSNSLALAGKKITLITPVPVTMREVDELFLGALHSVGLTVEPMGNLLRVIESSKARSSPVPFEPSAR